MESAVAEAYDTNLAHLHDVLAGLNLGRGVWHLFTRCRMPVFVLGWLWCPFFRELAFETGQGSFFQIQTFFNDALQPRRESLVSMEFGEKLGTRGEVGRKRHRGGFLTSNSYGRFPG